MTSLQSALERRLATPLWARPILASDLALIVQQSGGGRVGATAVGAAGEICMMQRMWRRLRNDEGANLVEAAVILPVILWVLFAGFEFSGILYAQMALQNGVTLATRFAITRVVLPSKSRTDSIKSVLKTDTPSLTIDDAAIIFSHMDAGSSTWTAGTGSANSIEKVSVTYSWTLMTPFMKYIFGSNAITLYAVSAMKNESDPGT